MLDAKDLEDDELFDALRMEIMLLKQLQHPYIVNLHEVVRDSERVYIIQECLGGGELFEQLLVKGPFKEDYALAIFSQVAIAVDYMHGKDVVHRDLKAENLVFAAKGSPSIKVRRLPIPSSPCSPSIKVRRLPIRAALSPPRPPHPHPPRLPHPPSSSSTSAAPAPGRATTA